MRHFYFIFLFYMKFEDLQLSKRKNKKFVIIFSEPNLKIHFGSKNSNTYLNHKDKDKRHNYIKRHQALGEDWDKINAASLSRYLLWGESDNLLINLKNYMKRFNIDY